MRNAFLLILFINFLAFVYQRWIMEPDVSVEPWALSQSVPELQAIAKEPPESAGLSGEIAVAETESRCMRIGPFSREADADEVRDALELRGAPAQKTEEEGRVWVGYWVQTAGQGSRNGAEKARASLVEGGMPDVYILPDTDDFRISLGVFRMRTSADTIIREARNMGFDTRIVERYQPGINYWLETRTSGERLLQPGELELDSGQILRTETVACKESEV